MHALVLLLARLLQESIVVVLLVNVVEVELIVARLIIVHLFVHVIHLFVPIQPCEDRTRRPLSKSSSRLIVMGNVGLHGGGCIIAHAFMVGQQTSDGECAWMCARSRGAIKKRKTNMLTCDAVHRPMRRRCQSGRWYRQD